MKPSFFSPHCNLTRPTRIQIRDRTSFNSQPPPPRPSRLHAKSPNFGDDLTSDLTTLEAVSKELMDCLQNDLEDLKRLKGATEIREKKLQMIENFEQVSMILERIKSEIESDLQPTQKEYQELELQLREMEQVILAMKQNVWNTKIEKSTQKANKIDSKMSLNFDDLECLTKEEKAELDWLLSEFLAVLEEDQDGGIYLMYFLKKFQSIKDQKTSSEKLQLDQLETGPILDLVNEYSTRFQPIKKEPPVAPKVSKSIKKMEESEELVEVGGHGGGDDSYDDDGDGGDESGDDENWNFRPLLFLIPCFLLGYAAFWIHKNKELLKSQPMSEKLERQIQQLLEKCQKTLSEMKGPGAGLGPPPPAHVSSNPIQWTGNKDANKIKKTQVHKEYIETGSLFAIEHISRVVQQLLFCFALFRFGAMQNLYRLMKKTVTFCSCLRRKRTKHVSSGYPLSPARFTPCTRPSPVNLQEACLVVLARNIGSLKRHRIDRLPTELAQRLFDRITSMHGLDSDSVWLFSHQVLTHVALQGNQEVNDDWISALITSPLTALDVSYSAGITDRGLSLCKKFRFLASLDLSYCSKITDNGFSSIAVLVKLESLSLRGCDLITGKTFGSLSPLTNLTYLNFELCRSLVTGLQPIGRLPNLESIDFGWCRELPTNEFIHLSSLTKLRRLQLNFTRITTNELKLLSALEGLSEIGLMGFKFNRDGLNSLSSFSNLQEINIERSILEFSHLGVIANFSKLKRLKMGFMRVNNRNFQFIAQVQSLMELEVNACRISDRGLTSLSHLTNLKSLNLSDTYASNGTLEHIFKLDLLRRLDLGGCEISDEGMTKISLLTNLRDLDLDSRELTDNSMPLLSTLTKLTKLGLFSARIKDESLGHLLWMKELKSLELCGGLLQSNACNYIMHLTALTYLNLSQNRRIGDQGISKLTKLSELRSLNLTSTRLSDLGLEALASLECLSFLVMYDTNISEIGVGRILETRPKLRLSKDGF